MNRTAFHKIGNIAAFAGTLFVNYLANAVPLGGQTTGQISDGYNSLFTPAGFTFAIWGVIYFFLAGFVVRQSLSIETEKSSISQIDWFFKVNCLANAAWIFTWHYDYLVLSLLSMFVILWTLIRIHSILYQDPRIQRGWSRVFIVLPFSIYFGWISVATLANISVLQSVAGFNDLFVNEVYWTIFGN